MTEWTESYIGEFDSAYTDKERLVDKIWVPCRLCWSIFKRLRLTAQYCHECHHGFCEGEHGSFDEKKNQFCCALHHSRTPSTPNTDTTILA
jgi:hypothetical protein